MPNLITPSELADEIADQIGIYGACPGEDCIGNCRPHFVSRVAERIRESVANEKLLDGTHKGGDQ